MDIPLTDYTPWLEWIKTQEERMISLVTAWSQVSSHSFDPQGLKGMADCLRAELTPLTQDIQEFSLSPQTDFNEEGQIITRALGKAITFRKMLPHTPSVLLNGHLDTVHRKERNFQPVRLSPSLLQGPGVADLKGGLVVALIALEALERSPFGKSISWELFCNPDEEVGSTGSYPYLQECARQHDCAFVFEPAMPDGRFVSSRMGAASYCLLAKGRAAHVGRDFKQGINAILLLLPIIEKLTQLSDPEKGVILSIGVIRGGDSSSTVPEHALIRFTLRAQTDDQMQHMRAAIQECIHSFERPSFPFSLLELSYRPPKPLTAKQEHFFRSVASVAQALSIPMEGCHTGGVCDGNFFAAVGLPTLDTMGPIGGNLHTEQEYLNLESLVPRATLMACLLMQIASGRFSLGGV